MGVPPMHKRLQPHAHGRDAHATKGRDVSVAPSTRKYDVVRRELAEAARGTSASTTILNGAPLPNIPWQDKPDGYAGVVWRHAANPIIGRSPFPPSNSVFNSAVVPFDGKFAGVFRCDSTSRQMQIHAGFSDNGVGWRIDP